MTYRLDDRPRCDACEAVLVLNEGVYAPDGRRVCRACHSRALVAQSDAELAADRVRRGGARPGELAQPERSPLLGSGLIAPGVALGAFAGLAALEHVWSGQSCSELRCLGIALFAFAGLFLGTPMAVLGVVLLPRRLRRRGGLVALGALLASLASLSPIY